MQQRHFPLIVILCILLGHGTVFGQPNRPAPTFRITILKNWTAIEDELPLYRVVEGDILEYNSQRGLILQLPSGTKETHHFASITAVTNLASHAGRQDVAPLTGREERIQNFTDSFTDTALQLLPVVLRNRQTANTTVEKNGCTAKLVGLYTTLGDEKSAVIEFAGLLASDTFSPYFDVVPLTWQAKTLAKTPSDAELDRLAMQILAATETAQKPHGTAAPSPVLSLWAASVLLTHADTAVRTRSIKVLDLLTFLENDLGTSPALLQPAQPTSPMSSVTEDMRYVAAKTAKLAAVQLWRTKLPTVRNDKELSFMENQLRGIPATQQAGPLVLIGDGYSRLGAPEKAVACWLKAAMTCPEQRTTAVYGLRQSIAALRQLNRPDQAASLQRLLDTQYP